MLYIAAFSFASCFVVIVAACWIACADAPHAFSSSHKRRPSPSQVRKARQSMIGYCMVIGVALLSIAAFTFSIAADAGALI